jgi:GNAT superfamily N-acetyltransferase
VSDLELVQVTHEADLFRWWQIDDAAMAADHVGLPADPMAELLPALAGSMEGFDIELWLGVSGDAAVGCVKLTLPVHDNLTGADLDVVVHPAQRGRGFGSRLVDGMLARVRELGRTVVTFEISRPLDADSGLGPGATIATRLGAELALTELRQLLDLTAAEPAGLAALVAEAAAHADGYTLVGWVDRAAPADLADLADLMGRMSVDSPHGDLDTEPEAWDVARYRAKEDSTAARGRRRYAVAARAEASERLVGYTEIGVNLAVPAVGYQWDTLVRSEHRGHRLGLLMKRANLQQLREHSPQTRYLNTWNGARNVPMLSVNEALGYRPVEASEEWQLRL